MASETDQISPETYQKLVTLSELIIQKNNIIAILGAFRQTKTPLSKKQIDIITNKYLSKIALIDKQMERVATGLSCSVCQEKLEITDEVLACKWCGSPSHRDHFLKHIKAEGYCPACGEYLKYHIRGSIKTVTHDLFKSCVYAFADSIHKLQIIYGDKVVESTSVSLIPECPVCKREITPDWNFCRYCGSRLEDTKRQEVQMMECPRCGKQIKKSWRFCKLCGYPLSRSD